jgi:hypothetical protein
LFEHIRKQEHDEVKQKEGEEQVTLMIGLEVDYPDHKDHKCCVDQKPEQKEFGN